MKTLLALNLVFLVFAVSAQTSAPVMRVSALEIVDERGVVRARLGIKGGTTAELDLFDRTGTIRVKLGAGERGSGLVLADDSAQPGVHLLAQRGETRLTLKEPGGKERAIRP
jgi:hypothetical protein